MTDDLSRRRLFTEALPSGLAGLLRGVLQARQDLAEWSAAAAEPLAGPTAGSSELVASLRQLDRELRLEHPELFPEDMPDPRDNDALERWIEERQERRRREREELVARYALKPDVAEGDAAGVIAEVPRRRSRSTGAAGLVEARARERPPAPVSEGVPKGVSGDRPSRRFLMW